MHNTLHILCTNGGHRPSPATVVVAGKSPPELVLSYIDEKHGTATSTQPKHVERGWNHFGGVHGFALWIAPYNLYNIIPFRRGIDTYLWIGLKQHGHVIASGRFQRRFGRLDMAGASVPWYPDTP